LLINKLNADSEKLVPTLHPKKKKERKEEWGVDSAPGGIHTNGSEIKVERE